MQVLINVWKSFEIEKRLRRIFQQYKKAILKEKQKIYLEETLIYLMFSSSLYSSDDDQWRSTIKWKIDGYNRRLKSK